MTRRHLLPLVPVFLAYSLAAAQDIDRETRTGARAGRQDKAAAQAAADAKRPEAGAQEVTWAEVLKDPDNVDLNYRYARSLVAKGNLRGAAATLERILMVRPDLPRVRLFYAIVLYRLDVLDAAEREFTALEALEMPDSLRAEIAEYRGLIRSRRRTLHFSVRAGVGAQYDTNRNAGPRSNTRLLSGALFTLTSGGRTADTAIISLARFEAAYDLGFQAGHQVYASVGAYRSDQFDLKTLSLDAYDAESGFLVKTAFAEIIPYAAYSIVRLDRSTLLKGFSAGLRLRKQLNDRTTLSLSGDSGFQDYDDTPGVAFASQRTGHRTSYTLGFGRVLSSRTSLQCEVGVSDYRPDKEFYGYEAESFSCTHASTLGAGMFFLARAGWTTTGYRAVDKTVLNRFREDDAIRLGATFGTPLTFLHRSLTDAVFTLGYEYFNSNSNLVNYDYLSHKVTGMLNYKFDF